MDLFEVDDVAFNVEPDTGTALDGRLVLPTVVSGTVTCDSRPFAPEAVVGRGDSERGAGQEVPALAMELGLVAMRSLQPL